MFELIQNAEDNDYTKAEAAGDEPLLIFRKYPNEIIIASNEDGFVEANVRAICTTGESTKGMSKILTRIVLTLAFPSEAKRIGQEFWDLPETLLSFLKLKRIIVTRSDAKGRGA